MPPSRPTVSVASAISAAVSRWQDATALYDEEVGARLDLAPSERRCLACLALGARPARDIAEATRLTRAAVTTLVDRLEERGLVTRTRDTADRRQVLVALTPEAKRLARHYYGPIERAGAQLLATFAPGELAAILRFIEEAADLQLREVDQLRKEAEGEG